MINYVGKQTLCWEQPSYNYYLAAQYKELNGRDQFKFTLKKINHKDVFAKLWEQQRASQTITELLKFTLIH